MQNSRVIGGEFDVDLQGLQYTQSNNGSLEGVYKYSSGRSITFFLMYRNDMALLLSIFLITSVHP